MTVLLEKNLTDVEREKGTISFVSFFDSSNPDVLRLQAFAAACGILLIAFIQILRFVTFMLVL